MALMMDRAELEAFLSEVFPQMEGDFRIESLEEGSIAVRLNTSDKHLRPGGTVSGPSMFSLADVAAYMLVLAHIGPQALAVTTNCSIDFMRKPESGKDLICEGRLLKLGRALAVSDVYMRSEGSDKIVARASLTYSIPPS
ncbi:MAG: PaaI family thioesterase [Pseudomonadota bacterium]